MVTARYTRTRDAPRTTRFAALRRLSHKLGERAGSAEEILRERFARGEISAEEYVKSYQVLRETSSQRSYEDYVRDVMERLRPGRGTGS
jgi:hypothetical protein